LSELQILLGILEFFLRKEKIVECLFYLKNNVQFEKFDVLKKFAGFLGRNFSPKASLSGELDFLTYSKIPFPRFSEIKKLWL